MECLRKSIYTREYSLNSNEFPFVVSLTFDVEVLAPTPGQDKLNNSVLQIVIRIAGYSKCGSLCVCE